MLQSAYSRLENGKVVVTVCHLQLLEEVFGKEAIKGICFPEEKDEI